MSLPFKIPGAVYSYSSSINPSLKNDLRILGPPSTRIEVTP